MRIYIKEYDMMDLETYSPVPVQAGETVTLVKRENVITGDHQWSFVGIDGAAGNSDPSILRYHGWRGTTNNWSRTAMGLRRIDRIERCKNGTWIVTLSDDIKPNEP